MLALDAGMLLEASSATSVDELNRLAFGIGPAALGDANADLVFTPLPPCRLFNTLVTGTPLCGGRTTTFGVNGTNSPFAAGNLSAQGGDASHCGVGADPAAVMMTLTYVNPTSGGNIRAFAYGGSTPLASSINFGTSPAALGNTTIIPVCVGCGTGLDIDLYADLAAGNTVHVVGDVVGIFKAPAGQACRSGTTQFADQCYDTSARAAVSTVYIASDNCRASGGRLPTALELRAIRDVSGITLDSGYEYTDSLHFDSPSSWWFMGVRDDGGTVQFADTSSHKFRCVFDRN